MLNSIAYATGAHDGMLTVMAAGTAIAIAAG